MLASLHCNITLVEGSSSLVQGKWTNMFHPATQFCLPLAFHQPRKALALAEPSQFKDSLPMASLASMGWCCYLRWPSTHYGTFATALCQRQPQALKWAHDNYVACCIGGRTRCKKQNSQIVSSIGCQVVGVITTEVTSAVLKWQPDMDPAMSIRPCKAAMGAGRGWLEAKLWGEGRNRVGRQWEGAYLVAMAWTGFYPLRWGPPQPFFLDRYTPQKVMVYVQGDP